MKDLFESYELMPKELQEVIGQYEEQMCNGFSYSELAEMLAKTEMLGYTFEYELDASPFALRPIGTELHEVEGYEWLKGHE